MRTLFTIFQPDAHARAFMLFMDEVGIKSVSRTVLTAAGATPHFVVDTEDYNSLVTTAWIDPEARRWEITACNKQYVRECVGDACRYLGSMCEVGPLNARDHNEEQPYHWSLYDGEQDIHWHAEFRNPNTIRRFISDPKKPVEIDRLMDEPHRPMTVTGRWPVDPRCPRPGLREDYVNHRSQRADNWLAIGVSADPA